MEVHYFSAGMFENAQISRFESGLDFPGLGITLVGNWNEMHRYLVLPKSQEVQVMEVAQRSGGIRYAVDPMLNPNSVELKIGGVFSEAPNVLIAGRMAYGFENEFSKSVYKAFGSQIKKEFRHIG